jgi:hypothetical protein
MWEPTNGVIFCGINKKILKRSSNLDIVSYGFHKRKKNKSMQIQEKMVWSIQGTILLTQ